MLGQLIAHGRTSDVHRYGRDGAAKVLKAVTPQHWAHSEASFTTAVRQLGIAAPEVRDVIEIDGRSAVIFERIDGPSMWQRMLDHPNDVAALVRELADIQRAIHEAGVPDGLPSLVDRVRLKLSNAAELTSEERSAADDLLSRQPVGAALLHGDLHPGNVLLGRRGPVVIDWFDATVGHPIGDVARTMLLLSAAATGLGHLPDSTQVVVAQMQQQFAQSVADRAAPAQLHDWYRLRAAGRLAEGADLDVSGLLAIWRSSDPTSPVDDD